MEKLILNFEGFIEVDKADLKLLTINDVTGAMDKVNKKTINKLTKAEIIEGVNSGKYCLSFVNNYKIALDGNETITIDDEDDDL